MNPGEDRITDALDALKRADSGRGAPARVEASLLDAFRNRPRPAARHTWRLAAAAVALLGLVLVLWITRSTPRRESTTAHVAVAKAPKPALETAPVRAIAQHIHRLRRPRRAAEKSPLIAQFIPVPYAPPLPSDEIRIVRVRVEPAALDPWALSTDPREAEVVAGADGIVRAVRWVR